jgi:Protein of unknown function (DUF4238)
MPKWNIPPANPSHVYLARARELEPETDKRIKNQHVVSKVLLKGFATRGARSTGLQLTPFDLRYGYERQPKGLAGCGVVPDFLKSASESAERLWKNVEDQLHTAIDAARQGHLHDRNSHSQAMADCIALHLVRSIRYLKLHQAIIVESAENTCQEVMHSRKALLETEFKRRYGLYPAGPEALALILEEPISEWLELDRRGILARASIEAMFRRVRDAFRSLAIEVLHVPHGCELLIADSPAVTLQYLAGNTSIIPNVAIGDAHSVVLPLARDCMVAIGPNPEDGQLSPDQVIFFNRLQIQMAYRYVYYRPGSRLKALVQATMPTRAQQQILSAIVKSVPTSFPRRPVLVINEFTRGRGGGLHPALPARLG